MALELKRLTESARNLRRRAEVFLWRSNMNEAPWYRRLFIRTAQISTAIIRDLFQEQLSLRAMSLVFTTLIGFFPLFALTFAVLKSLGVHNAMEPTLMALLDPLGDRSAELTQQILSYVDNLRVELIGITSIGLLLYIVLDMMRKIESAFNYIWAVKKGRSWANRISEYLFAVIVSPLLLFISISITSYVNTNFFAAFLENLAYGSVIIQFTATLAPILLMSLAFAFAYGFLPNTKVQFSSAFIGGFVTTIIWKLMGLFFQEFFVTSARESIYLAFASAIVIMFFIYIGWLVALIGSSIAFYHQYPAKARTGRERLNMSISQRERIALTVADLIIERFNKGEKPMCEEDIIAHLQSSPPAIESALMMLQDIGLITETVDDPVRYLPTRSVSNSTLVDVWQALRNANNDERAVFGDSPELERINEFQEQMDNAIEEALGQQRFSQSQE